MDYQRSEAKRAALERFRGVWAAITTPFTPDNRIDEPGLRRALLPRNVPKPLDAGMEPTTEPNIHRRVDDPNTHI
jgi:hypothetical protein